MKLFRLLSTTAATVLAIAALAVSANAMTATYNAPTETTPGTITLVDIETNAPQKTLLVLNENAENVAQDDIVQIDQAASFATVTVGNLTAEIDAANQALVTAYEEIAEPTKEDFAELEAAWTPSDEYYIRVGGSGVVDPSTGKAFEAYTLTVNTTVDKPTAPPDAPPVPEYVLAELDGVTGVGIGDAIELLKYCATLREFNDIELLAAELDAVTGVGIGDAIELLKYCATLIDKFPVEQ